MNRGVVGASILALAFIGVASPTAAHHPPRFERCKSVAITGRIESVNWANPHVVVSIKSDDGTIHQALWLNVQQLGRAGIQQDTLAVGDQVVVTAGTRDGDPAPLLMSAIGRPSDGWQWSQKPQGC
jgi:Family of unknown function (DUF6152)